MGGPATIKEKSELQQPQHKENAAQSNLLEDFWRSAVKSGVENPYNAVAQIANHASGKKVIHELRLVDAPAPVDNPLSPRGVAESLGTIAGMLPTFWLTSKAVGAAAGMLKRAETAGTVTLVGDMTMSARKFALAEAAVTGGTYGGLLTPADSRRNFWESRAANAGLGATAVMSMGWANHRFPRLQPAASGFIGGSIGGAINAEGQSILYKHKIVPGAGEFTQSVLAWGSMGAIGARFGPGETRMDGAKRVRLGENLMESNVPEALKQSLSELRLGRRLLSDGSVPEAVNTLEKAVGKSVDTLGEGHPVVADQLSELGDAYFRSGKHRYQDAENSVQHALQIRTSQFGTTSPEVARTLEQLSIIQSARMNHADAAASLHASARTWDSLYQEGRLSQYEGADHLGRRRNLYERVARLYRAGGNSAMADEIVQSLPPPPSVDTRVIE